MSERLPVLVRELPGLWPYEPVWRAMQAFTDARTADTTDEFWLLQHEPVFTLGQAGEQAVIATLEHWNIAAERREGAPGVYVAGAKVAALGLRVRRGCSFHGLAFNAAMDLEPFHRINPCGYKGLAVTQVLDLGGPASLAVLQSSLVDELARQLELRPQAADPVIPAPAPAVAALA